MTVEEDELRELIESWRAETADGESEFQKGIVTGFDLAADELEDLLTATEGKSDL